MLEKVVEKKLVQGLQARGAMVFKFVSPGRQGVPDRIAILPGGRVVFVELKTETGRLSKLQQIMISRMRIQGAEVHVVYGADSAQRLIDYLFPGGGDADGV